LAGFRNFERAITQSEIDQVMHYAVENLAIHRG